MVYGLVQYYRMLTVDGSWSQNCLDTEMFFVDADKPNQIIIDDFLPIDDTIDVEYFEVCKQNVSDEWIVIGEFNLDDEDGSWFYTPEAPLL